MPLAATVGSLESPTVIVRPFKIVDIAGNEMASHPAIEVGRDYLVLALTISGDRQVVQILSEHDGQPGIWPLQIFELVSEKVSRTWSASIRFIEGGSNLILGPVEWHRPGFWTEYWDRRPEGAGDEFARAVGAMAAEEGLPPDGRVRRE